MGNTAQQCTLGLFLMTLTLPEILKTQNRPQGNFVHIRKSYVCSHKLDVQEANVSFTQFNGNLRLFLLMLVYAWMEFLLLISGVWFLKCSTLLPTNSKKTPKERVQGYLLRDTSSSMHTNLQTKISVQHDDLEFLQCRLSFLKREVFSIWCDALHL